MAIPTTRTTVRAIVSVSIKYKCRQRMNVDKHYNILRSISMMVLKNVSQI